jgi:hypothetical protein
MNDTAGPTETNSQTVALSNYELEILIDIYNNPGLFNVQYKTRTTQRLNKLGFLTITFPAGYEHGRLYATGSAEKYLIAEKAKCGAIGDD